MSNTSIIRVQKALYTIKKMLLQDDTIKKLLGNMVPNALEIRTPDEDWFKNQDVITLTPYIDYENGIKESQRNGFIAIYLEELNRKENHLGFMLNIAVMVRQEYYEINGNKIRTLEILSRIVEILDGKKLQAAGKVNLLSAETMLIENAKMIGMFSHWEVVDGEEIPAVW